MTEKAKKKIEEFVATGRRKRAVASVRLRPEGSGKVDVNGRSLDKYFPEKVQQDLVYAPFKLLGVDVKYDIILRANGGGLHSQAEAARLGISRALLLESEDRKGALKEEGFLRRDPRKKERKKYGKAGARKSFQFSKR